MPTGAGQPSFIQIGIPLSYFSAKTRSYLLHKGIPFEERGPTLTEFAFTLQRHTGARALPVLRTPEGEWLQDTSVIIDTLERRFPDRPALPHTPVQRFVALLLELWVDELWVPLAMHTRWSHPENVPFFIEDAAQHMLPGLPLWLRRAAGRHVARQMQSYLEAVGVAPAQHAVMDRFLSVQLDALEAHFRRHAFLLGDRPCLADYSLAGPLWAHIGRDPWPRRELIAPRPALARWIERTMDPASATGELLADDALPQTLDMALDSALRDLLPWLRAACTALRASPVLPAGSGHARRIFDPVEYPLGNGMHRRGVTSYSVWMLRRLLGDFRNQPPAAQQRVQEWLGARNAEGILTLDPPPARRVGLAAAHVAAADAEGSA